MLDCVYAKNLLDAALERHGYRADFDNGLPEPTLALC
jgi:hypothetical protein